jgi:enoyl-CoA hydratase/carnithine racemase
MAEFVSVRREGAVAVVTLEREAKLNAISAAVEASLCSALSDPVVRDAAAVVFTGARAKELALLRERVSASEALRLGLVTEVVGAGDALARAVEHAARLASIPSLALRVTKRVIDVMAESSRAAGLELERLAYGLLAQTPEADTAAAEFGR